MTSTATRPQTASDLGRLLRSASVRTKILGMVLGLSLVLGLSVTWQVRNTASGVLEHELDLRGASIASDLASRASEPMLLGDLVALHELVDETVLNHEDMAYAFVVRADGAVAADTFVDGGVPVALLDAGRDTGTIVFDSGLGRIHDFRQPVLGGRAGFVQIGMSDERMRSLIGGVTIQMLMTTAAVALVGIGAAVFLTRILVRPILDLVDATRRVGSGDLSVRAERWAGDEIGVLSDAFNQMVGDLEVSQETIADKERARTMLLDKLMLAQEEERKRIARELHDGVGQSLNSLVLGLSGLAAANGSHAVEVERLTASTLETLESVRQLSRELRPSVLDDLGLADAIAVYAGEVAAHHPGLVIDTHLALDRRLSPSEETAVYRMVQESVTNSVRHSGAGVISVVLDQGPTRTRVIVEDDGTGFDVDDARRRGRVGLHAISERAELMGGTAEFESGSTGTTVFIEVPV
jgi:signal transduction histidine kinase